MYILSVKSSTEQGAYAVEDEEGKRVIFLFEEEDDAVRYAMMMSMSDELSSYLKRRMMLLDMP